MKSVLWVELLHYLPNIHHGSWTIIGGFNEIQNHNEKCGGAKRPNKELTLFHYAMSDYNLFDLEVSRGRVIWSNNRTDASFTKEKLDIALASTDWISCYGDGDV